jgi:hypothetical protein
MYFEKSQPGWRGITREKLLDRAQVECGGSHLPRIGFTEPMKPADGSIWFLIRGGFPSWPTESNQKRSSGAIGLGE